MPWTERPRNFSTNSGPELKERLIAAACYLTFGLAGMLFIIISGSRSQSRFFQFNFIQSIILCILSMLISWAATAMVSILAGILGLVGLSGQGVAITVGIGLDIFGKVGFLLLVYGIVWALMGKFCEIPWISEMVRRQMR